jgi:hypothetical protein
MNLSRTKIIIASVAVLIIFGGAALWLYGRIGPATPIPPQEQPGVSGGTAPGGGASLPPQAVPQNPAPESFPVAANPAQRLTRLTDFAVVAPSLNKSGDRILFYKKDGGDLYAADFDGKNQTKLSNITIVGILDAVWSPARDRAAVSYLDGDTIKSFLHIGTSSVAVLPAGITSAAWSPDGKSLAYTRHNGGDLELTISDAGAKNGKVVFRTPLPDARITWVSADRIVFATPPSGLAEGYLFAYSRASGSFERIFGPVYGLMARWSPYDTRMMASYTPRGGGRVFTRVVNPLDPAPKDSRELPATTLADKCVFAAKEELWCTIPRTLDGALPLPDRYLAGEFASSDRIVRIDLIKNNTEEIFDENDFDIGDLVADAAKNYLFFVNRRDGTLWSLRLQ